MTINMHNLMFCSFIVNLQVMASIFNVTIRSFCLPKTVKDTHMLTYVILLDSSEKVLCCQTDQLIASSRILQYQDIRHNNSQHKDREKCLKT
jgi:hypothetical protein